MTSMRRQKTWLEDHDIDDETFRRMKREGLAPKTLKIGRRVFITEEATAEWLQTLEARQQAAAA